MAITALPTPPLRSDAASFASRGDAFLAALPTFATEANALETNVNNKEVSATAQAAAALASANAAAASAASAAAYDDATGTSATSMAISVANGKVFTVESGRSWVAGMKVIAYYNATNYMTCTVASYSGSTLTLDCTAITGSGTYASWAIYPDLGTALYRINIFGSEAQTLLPASALENITPPTYATGMGAKYIAQVLAANSLFVAAANVAASYVWTSPNGQTWTARAMPTNSTHLIGSNGTNMFIASVSGAATIAKSTDGITWTAGTSLPSGAAVSAPPCFNGNTCLVATTANTCFVSSDNGVTWSAAQTLPAAVAGQNILSINGLFWYMSSTTVAYTSSTGLTGSWTSRALPVTVSTIAPYHHKSLNGNLQVARYTTPFQIYESSDGINWTQVHPGLSYLPVRIGSTLVTWSATLGGTKTSHGTSFAIRASNIAPAILQGSPAMMGNLVALPSNVDDGSVAIIDLSNPVTALFSR